MIVPPRYYTATLAAELLRQGHAREAADMYAALVEQTPGDPYLMAALSRANALAGTGEVPSEPARPGSLIPLFRQYAGLLAELHGLDGLRRLRDALLRSER